MTFWTEDTHDRRGYAMSLAEIGEAEGISRERVRQIIDRALAKLRRSHPATLAELLGAVNDLASRRHDSHLMRPVTEGGRRAGAQ